ncbi:MAG: hypothetical protein R3F34_11170 [Planctomycetota bacterium]
MDLRTLRALAPLAISPIALAVLHPNDAVADQLLWSQWPDGATKLESSLQTAPPRDTEAADDFDVTGWVRRVRIHGSLCFDCTSPDVVAVTIRFHEWNAGEVGTLLVEHRVVVDDPSLSVDELRVETLDVALPEPFHATGRHFVSVQLEVASSSTWYWNSSGDGQHALSTLRWRDGGAGGAFSPYSDPTGTVDRDLAFELWGEGVAGPTGTNQMVWAQYPGFLTPVIPASTWPGAAKAPEVADDFDFVGSVERLQLGTQVCFGCQQPSTTGARVRFYDWTSQGPGALLHDVVVPVGPSGTDFQGLLTIVELPVPFVATGKHFVSVQLQAVQANGFEWRSTGTVPAALSPVFVRDDLGSQIWRPALVNGQSFGGDMALQIFGVPAPAPPPTVVGDPCGPWKSVPVPFDPLTSHSVLRDVKVFAEDDVFAVGTRSIQFGPSPNQVVGGTVSYHFDGERWTELATPSPEPYPGAGGASLQAIDGTGPTDVWAAGVQNLQGSGGFVGAQILAMHWDGSSWSVVPTPVTAGGGGLQGTSGAVVRDIEVLGSNAVWFVGDWVEPFACRQSLAMYFDGSSFTVVDTPCANLPGSNDGFGLEAISAVSHTDIWAVGGGGDGDYNIHGYVIHWDGSSWTHVPTPAPGITHRLFAVEALAADDVWATGQYLDGLGHHAYAIHWDGSGWTLHELVSGSLGLWAASSTEVYAVGGAVSKWDGTAWTLADDLGAWSGENIGVSLTAVDGLPNCVVAAVGRHAPLGRMLPFAARPHAASWWDAEVRNGCHGATLHGGLTLVEPPKLGSTCRVAIDDPSGAAGLTPGATFAAWFVSATPGAAYPCGTVLPGFGSAGLSAGEALVEFGPFWFYVPAGVWNGPGQPLDVDLAIPGTPWITGRKLFTQALLFDPVGAAGPVVTNSLDLRLGS